MNILLLEDDSIVATFIEQALASAGYTICVCSDLPEVTSHMNINNFDCLILDRHLPSGDSIEFVIELASKCTLPPILFLTALDSIEDRIAGLSIADDYLIKPFDIGELIARVKALVRRKMKFEPILEGASITMHRIHRTVTRQEVNIEINPMEFKLLEYLLLNKNQVVSRQMLLQHVWEYNFEPATSIVETYISRLRNKLDVEGLPPAITTLRGIGYTIADV
jgi:two-component system OmpR family response regulator